MIFWVSFSSAVGQRSVQIGQQVGPRLALMSIISLERLWVEANFKEGQIRSMRVGQANALIEKIIRENSDRGGDS